MTSILSDKELELVTGAGVLYSDVEQVAAATPKAF